MKFSKLHCNLPAITATLGLLAFGAAAQANAGCIDVMKHTVTMSPSNHSGFVPAVYRADVSDTAPARNRDFRENASIVGLWEFKFSGFVQDFGTQAFHAGGTETMFSGGVDPPPRVTCARACGARSGPQPIHSTTSPWHGPRPAQNMAFSFTSIC